MFRYLVVGFLEFDPEIKGNPAVRKPLDMLLVKSLIREIGEEDDQGNPTLGGFPVRFEDGCVVCPWYIAGRVEKTKEFVKRLCKAAGCDVVDMVKRNTRLDPEKLE